MIQRNQRTLALCAAIAVMLACAPIFQPAVIPPTLDPFSLNTVIAQTADAAAAQTAAFAPATFTPIPTILATDTPTEVPSATPTFIFILPSLTATRPTSTPVTSGGNYSCELLSQVPADQSEFEPKAIFSTRWQVRNNGSYSWNSNSTDYRYTGGDKLHVNPVYDLFKTVPPNGGADIVVDMKAPSDAGTYSTTWKIRVGKTEFCKMTLTIIVK